MSLSFERYWHAFLDTLMMVGVSSSIAFLAGIPLAILLIVTAPNGFLASPRINKVVARWSTVFAPRHSSYCWSR